MLNFKFKKLVFNFFLILFTSSLFSEDNSFFIDQSVFLDGNIFVKEKTNIKSNLEVEGIRVIYDNFDIKNNLKVEGNVLTENFSVSGVLSFSIFEKTGLDYVCKVINIGDFSNNDKKVVNIGSVDSGKTTIDSGDIVNGISIGTETLNIVLGDNEEDEITKNINISAKNININSEKVKYLISDFGDLPLLTDQNLIRIDQDKYLSSINLSIVTGNDAEFDKLNSNGTITLFGSLITNNGEGTSSFIGTGGTGNILIGGSNSEVELLGQWDIVAEDIKIENTEGSISIGFPTKVVRLSQLSENGNLYLSESENIIFPLEGDVSALKIYGDGSLTTGTGQLNDNINFIGLTITDETNINGLCTLNDGEDPYEINIGNIAAGLINLISKENIEINSNSDLNLKGNNLILNLSSQTLPDATKQGHLLIDLNGNINILNSGFSSSLDIGTLICNGPFNLLKGIAVINKSGASNINISNDDNDAVVNIGNSSSGSLNLNSGDSIQIGLNSPLINIGSDNIEKINLLTKSDSGLITLAGENLQLNNDLESDQFLSIDSHGYVLYENPSYKNGDDLYLSNVNLTNVSLNGDVIIGDDNSTVQIECSHLIIGDKEKSTLTFNKDVQIISKNLDISANELPNSIIKIGKNIAEGNTVVNISSMKASNNLAFYLDNIRDLVFSLGAEQYLTLSINKDKEVTVKFFEDTNTGKITFNKESSGNIQLGNFDEGGPVRIKSKLGLILENTNDYNIFIRPNRSLIISSEDIDLPAPLSAPVPLYIEQTGKYMTTTSGLVKNKNNSKVKDLKITQKNLIKFLKPKSFFYNDKKYGTKEEYGLIAEDLQDTVLDSAVVYSSNKSILGIDYEKIFNLITNDYKFFSKNITELKEKNENLKEKCFYLINNFEKLKAKK